MKKLITLLLSLLLCSCVALAEAPALTAEIFVSITDDSGALVMAYAPVTVTDTDADGVLTICDALTAAHAAGHPDGAAAFGTVATEYGLSMTRLWGTENGGSYGYCLNDQSAWSLADPIAAGDHVKAYAYTDLIAWSDMYCCFDVSALTVPAQSEVTLTLRANGYDEMWNPVVLPVANAAITLNGLETGLVTDAQGMVTLPAGEPGEYVVSAFSTEQTLVAPVCILTVAEAE